MRCGERLSRSKEGSELTTLLWRNLPFALAMASDVPRSLDSSIQPRELSAIWAVTALDVGIVFGDEYVAVNLNPRVEIAKDFCWNVVVPSKEPNSSFT